MAEPNRGDSASARVLCEVVDEWLKVRKVREEKLIIYIYIDEINNKSAYCRVSRHTHDSHGEVRLG